MWKYYWDRKKIRFVFEFCFRKGIGYVGKERESERDREKNIRIIDNYEMRKQMENILLAVTQHKTDILPFLNGNVS